MSNKLLASTIAFFLAVSQAFAACVGYIGPSGPCSIGPSRG